MSSAAFSNIEQGKNEQVKDAAKPDDFPVKYGPARGIKIPSTSLFDLSISRLKSQPKLEVDTIANMICFAYNVLDVTQTLEFMLRVIVPKSPTLQGEETLRLLDATVASLLTDTSSKIPKLDVASTPKEAWLTPYFQKIACKSISYLNNEDKADAEDAWIRNPYWKYVGCEGLDAALYGVPKTRFKEEQGRNVCANRARYVIMLQSFYNVLYGTIEKVKNASNDDKKQIKTVRTSNLPLDATKEENLQPTMLSAKTVLSGLQQTMNNNHYPCSVAVIEAKIIMMCQSLYETYGVFVETTPFRKVFNNLSLAYLTSSFVDDSRDATFVIHHWINHDHIDVLHRGGGDGIGLYGSSTGMMTTMASSTRPKTLAHPAAIFSSPAVKK
jgi:hypothetical protein